MTTLNLGPMPIGGQPDSTEDPKVTNAFTALTTWANGNIDATNMTAAFAQSVAANQAGQTVKAQFNKAAADTLTNQAAYTSLGDVTAALTVPANALVLVSYQALWKPSGGTATAALFAGATQLRDMTNSGAPAVQSTQYTFSGGANTGLAPVYSAPYGMTSAVATTTDASENAGPLAAGTASASAAGPAWIWNLSPGTYTFGVQFTMPGVGNTLTVQNRHLWALVLSFT